VPWNILVDRETDGCGFRKSFSLYRMRMPAWTYTVAPRSCTGAPLELFSNQIDRVDASIRRSGRGGFSMRSSARRAGGRNVDHPPARLPDAPETYYLMELMASHDFQTALQNYLDLEDLRSRLIA